MQLLLRWKPPLYSGNSIYSYNIRMKEHQVETTAIFPFRDKHYHVLMDTQHDNWIRSQSIWVAGPQMKFEVEVFPINDAGVGSSVIFFTDGE